MFACPMKAWTSIERPDLHGQRAEGVAQVVEHERVVLLAQVAEPGCLERGVEAVAHVGVVERSARRGREDVIVRPVR